MQPGGFDARVCCCEKIFGESREVENAVEVFGT